MSPFTHFVGSWLIASATTDNPRDRKLVALAGILPDLDGLGLVADVVVSIASGREMTFDFYHRYHHLWTHGWLGAILVSSLLMCFAKGRLRAGVLCLAVFHLHLFCDWIGSRGPDPGDLWPVNYGEPLFRHPVWHWNGQWRLDGWQNRIISMVLFGLTLCQAVRLGNSPVEIVSQRADCVFTGVLRKWRDQIFRRNFPAKGANQE